jgi:hypothetical protein
MSVQAIKPTGKRPAMPAFLFLLFLSIIRINLYICNPIFKHAWMAELVDALVSGTSVRKDVQVRVLFQAP